MLTIEPSAGYWNDCTSAGRRRRPFEAAEQDRVLPGIVMRERNALAPVVGALGWRRAAASVAERRATATTATAMRITAIRVARRLPSRPPDELGGDGEEEDGEEARSVVSGSSVARRAPTSTPAIEATPTTSAVLARRFP